MVKAVVGANWGDEGKGKITDMLACDADIVVRFQGGANAGMKVKGVIQWVNADDCVDVTLNEFDYLLLDGEGDFNDRLTPDSKVVHTGAKAEGMLKNAKPYDRFQFMRMGYYSAVKGYGEGRYEFNMITGLKDSYGK